MDVGVKDRTGIVTGASGGIGRGLVLAFAQEGANVVRASRDEGQSVVDEIVGHGGDALLVAADVTQRIDVDAMIAAKTKRIETHSFWTSNGDAAHDGTSTELR